MARLHLLIAFCLAAICPATLACMAMVPTHPSITRPPPLTTQTPPDGGGGGTTTTAVATTSSATTTTTLPPTCEKCTPFEFKAPTPIEKPEICGGDTFYCTDDSLLVKGTTPPCPTVMCKTGKLFAYDVAANTAEPVIDKLTCALASSPKYEDAAAPPKTFLDGSKVFCQADKKMCMCTPALMYDTGATVPMDKLVTDRRLAKFGCTSTNCGDHDMEYMDGSGIIASVTCNPALGMLVDDKGMPVTKTVRCRDCGCAITRSVTNICPPAHFCSFLDQLGSTCRAKCEVGDTLFVYKKESTPPMVISEKWENVRCDATTKMWTPIGVTTLLQQTCATPAASLLMAIPPNMVAGCPLADLMGGTFTELRFKTITFYDGVTCVLATCRTGFVSGRETPASTADLHRAELSCCPGRSGFFTTSDPNFGIPIGMATCKTDSCTQQVMKLGFGALLTLVDVMQLEIGQCHIKCKTGMMTHNGAPVEKLTVHDQTIEYADMATGMSKKVMVATEVLCGSGS